MEYSASHYLHLLKISIITTSGILCVKPDDCDDLQQEVNKSLGLYNISVIALKRIYGFSPSKFMPSTYTLDVLSMYCGFENWEEFCKRNAKDKTPLDNGQI